MVQVSLTEKLPDKKTVLQIETTQSVLLTDLVCLSVDVFCYIRAEERSLAMQDLIRQTSLNLTKLFQLNRF